MRAMVLEKQNAPLVFRDLPDPAPGPGEVRLKVEACGVCRTDLHILDGELSHPNLPLILGHEIVGRVDALGAGVDGLTLGQRAGVPWLGRTCGTCPHCRAHRENLCDAPEFTGYDRNGGYAELCVADAGYVFPLPDDADPVRLAPLLCAGLIGYRTLKLAGSAERIGFYGFGAAAHILCQLCVWQGKMVYAFTRPGDQSAQAFARRLGAVWAGSSDDSPPEPLDAALIFAPVGALVPKALKAVRKGGCVVSGGIHMSDIPTFPYADLWHERVIRSVANLTRSDGEEFLPLAIEAGIETETTIYRLEQANLALDDLRSGRFTGAAVLVP
ncbi:MULTISPECIES: zinc-dependent alcohol dehydrogenase family protein [Roseobacteraceae]|uniref:zinc-dependent alcohol dehydrogenase family protein n=1 Tax=Roseobacteraceae TaxID=2854170 RepID=UPI00125FC862|nr:MULTISPECIES: zinc-dependent alcohol dehydrogenase family protein [Roseobacteraceae]KAB6714647.1 alcohol dehydrogenase [Roseobacter sp. TSBP12]|tara:strand:- start:5586 stop:6569 length:984 start_codon:yes stop_codon:yes gene_type:complete